VTNANVPIQDLRDQAKQLLLYPNPPFPGQLSEIQAFGRQLTSALPVNGDRISVDRNTLSQLGLVAAFIAKHLTVLQAHLNDQQMNNLTVISRAISISRVHTRTEEV